MTVRTPLILDGSNNLIEMTTAQINAVKDRCRYLYGTDPSVTLSRVSSGGNLGNMVDSRLTAGAVSTSTGNQDADDDGDAEYVPETSTQEPQLITGATYGTLNESRADTAASVDTNNIAFPLYQTNGDLKAMTLTDVYDTFIYPAIDTITASVDQPGSYRIHTATTLSNYTAVSNTAIFTDTRANPSSYNANEIGDAGQPVDHDPSTITSFYLLKYNNISAPSMEQMIYIRSDNDIQQYSQAEMDVWLKNSMRHAASEITGSKISYNLNGTGINLGSLITDTKLNGSGNYQKRFVNLNDYRSQEFPDGTEVIHNSYRLKINQV